MKNYYKILGVNNSDTTETIKKAYKKRARETHPDLHAGDPKKEQEFKEIGEAWDVLGNDTKRKKYDMELSGANYHQPKKKATTKTAPVGQVDLEEMMKGFGDIFSEEQLRKEVPTNKKSGATFDSEELFRKFMGFK